MINIILNFNVENLVWKLRKFYLRKKFSGNSKYDMVIKLIIDELWLRGVILNKDNNIFK